MSIWRNKIIISDKPNFYYEAVYLLWEYFDRKNKNDAHRNLITQSEGFTVSASAADDMFSDVKRYINENLSGALNVIASYPELEQWFMLVPNSASGQRYGFLKHILSLAQVNTAKDISPELFRHMCITELRRLANAHNDAQPVREAQNAAAFTIRDVFTLVNKLGTEDSNAMRLLRFFQSIDEQREKITHALAKLEALCKKKYIFVRKRFEKTILELHDRTKEHTALEAWLERIETLSSDLSACQCVRIQTVIMQHNAASGTLSPPCLMLHCGILFEELSKLQTKNRTRDELNQVQLKALSEPARYAVLCRLADRPHYAQELAHVLKLTPATLSHHINILQNAFLVCSRTEGRKVFYSLNSAELRQCAEALIALAGREEEKKSGRQ